MKRLMMALACAVAATATAHAATRPEPLAFERNDGQTDARARFVARAEGAAVFVTPSELVVAPRAGAPLRMRFAGADPAARVTGEESRPGVANYFRGTDRSRWLVGIPTFSRVRAERLYPGVDAVFYGRDGRLEYDLVVAPGADPDRIALEIAGARVDGDGGLRAGAGRLSPPVAYQEAGGARRAVAARWIVRQNGLVGLALGEYDRGLPLVVDPVLSFSTYLAGTGDESGAGVTVDAAGNVYVVGGTTSIDFPATTGAFATSNAGLSDGFVTKLAPDGATVLVSTYFGGTGDEGVARVAVDASGNVTVCGGTGSANFPTTPGAFQTGLAGGFDGFVARLDATMATLVYSTYLGGTGDDGASGVALDASGNAYITGASTSNNYPTTPGAFDTSNASLLGFPDAVVTKLNATGTALVYSTYLGGGFNLEGGAAIAVDASGNAYVAGATNGGFPTVSGSFDTSYNGGAFDAFVTKVNPAGSGLVYSSYLGGNDEDYAFGLALDAAGNVYLTGYTPSTNFPVASAFQGTIAGGFDAFVTKLNAAGSALVYSSYLGGTGNEGLTSSLGTELQIAGGIAVDAAGAAYVTGFTDSIDFPTTAPWQAAKAGGFDAWVAKIAPAGTSKEYASYLGGELEERGLGIAVDPAGTAVVTGFTLSAGFPTTAGVVGPTPPAGLLSNGWVTKVGAGPGDTPGVYVPETGAWFLRTANSPGPANAVFSYGPGGVDLVALAGDWDGNGTTTAGLYDPTTGSFFLKNRNTPGGADLVFSFGPGGSDFIPLVGDWNGDGTDTIGIYFVPSGAFFLRNANAGGGADLVFSFGPGGADFLPLSGDWNGDGTDTVGIYFTATGGFFLRNANAGGGADLVFSFGAGGSDFVPLAGDWNADGTDTIGIYFRPSGAWFLRNSNSSGGADLVFSYGPALATPLVGHWGG